MSDAQRVGASEVEAILRTLGYTEGAALEVGATLRAPAPSAAREVRDAGVVDATLAAPAPSAAVVALASRDEPAPLPRLTIASASDAPNGAELRVLRRLGEGGMGAVDLAVQRSLEREVALKRLHAHAEPSHARALLHEGRLLGRLEHPSVVPVHALGVDDAGRPVLVLKRVEGVAWSALLDDAQHPLWASLLGEGRDALAAHLEVLRQVCNALSLAHARGVVHRDVKPDNVMVGSFGEVYLLDWGVALDRGALDASRGARSEVVGTPCFLAPELLRGPVAEHDERTDVYLLGATLHAVLTGTPRHAGATLPLVLLEAYESRPVAYDASVPEELAALCNAATARDKALRPASAEAFRRALERFLAHRGAAELARTAAQALDEARALDDRRGPGDEALARRRRTEAHFGFVQSLRAWPEGAAAKAGLARCLAALCEAELAARNAEGATALLDELEALEPTALLAAGAPVEALRGRCAALRAELERERAEAARARAYAASMDRSVSARSRAALMLVGVLAFVADYALYRAQARAGVAPSLMASVVQSDVLLLTLYVVAVALGRRKLLGNTISAQLTLTLGAMLLGGATSDALAWRLRVPLEGAAVLKFVVGGFVLVTAGIALERALLVPAALSISAAVLMALVPSAMEPVGMGASLAVLVSFFVLALRGARQRRVNGSGSASAAVNSS